MLSVLLPAHYCCIRAPRSATGAPSNCMTHCFGLSAKRYGRNQLRYDLHKLRAHALLERDATHYAYRLTDKGVKVALIFVLFHQHPCGPLANSVFHHRPNPEFQPDSGLEAALHRADTSIRNIIQLLQPKQHCWTAFV